MAIQQNLLCAVAIFAVTKSAHAQLAHPFPSAVHNTIEKVLNAFQDEASEMQGDTISYNDHFTVFVSTIKPAGALECTLTEFQDDNTSDYVWKSVMFRTDDFDNAVEKYNSYYQQLKNMPIHNSLQSAKMQGEFQETKQAKNFYSTVLQAATGEASLDKLRLEILLENDLTEWTVSILVYDKDREDWQEKLGR